MSSPDAGGATADMDSPPADGDRSADPSSPGLQPRCARAGGIAHHRVDVDAQRARAQAGRSTRVVAAALDLALAVERERAAAGGQPRPASPELERRGSSATPTGVTSPGASGTCQHDAPPARGSARGERGGRGPRRARIGSSWAATAESPTAAGLGEGRRTARDSASWPPQGARADEALAAHRDVHEREVGLVRRRARRPARPRARSARARRHAARGDQAGGQAGHGGLAHLREDVVRPGGEGAERDVAARLGHDAVGAVAAEHGDRARRRPRTSRATARMRVRRRWRSAARRAPRAPGRARRVVGTRRAACAAGASSADESPSPAGIISTRSTPAAPEAGEQAVDHRRPSRRCRRPTRRSRAG